MNLKKDMVVVVGGLGLIGQAIIRKLEDQKIFLIDSQKNSLSFQNVEQSIVSNLSLKESEQQILQELKPYAHRISGWINVLYPKTPLYGQYNYLDDEQEDGIEFLKLHGGAYYRACRVAIRILEEAKGGNIVNFGSIYGPMGPDMRIYSDTNIHNSATYAMVKEAILGLTRYIATCFASKKIRCNAICPGGVQDKQNELFVRQYSHRVPLGRLATPEEVAQATAFLISEESSYITGQALMVDGGLSAW